MPRRAARRAPGRARDEVRVERRARVAADAARSAAWPPLPRSRTHGRVAEVDVVDVEPDRLGDPRAGARTAARAAPGRAARAACPSGPTAASSALHVVDADRLRQPPRPASAVAARGPGRRPRRPSRSRKRCSPRTADDGAGRRAAASGGAARRPRAARSGRRRRRPRATSASRRCRAPQVRQVAPQVAAVGRRACCAARPRSTARWRGSRARRGVAAHVRRPHRRSVPCGSVGCRATVRRRRRRVVQPRASAARRRRALPMQRATGYLHAGDRGRQTRRGDGLVERHPAHPACRPPRRCGRSRRRAIG